MNHTPRKLRERLIDGDAQRINMHWWPTTEDLPQEQTGAICKKKRRANMRPSLISCQVCLCPACLASESHAAPT